MSRAPAFAVANCAFIAGSTTRSRCFCSVGRATDGSIDLWAEDSQRRLAIRGLATLEDDLREDIRLSRGR